MKKHKSAYNFFSLIFLLFIVPFFLGSQVVVKKVVKKQKMQMQANQLVLASKFMISKVTPNRAQRGDTIRIYGSGFLKRKQLCVHFEGYSCGTSNITKKSNTCLHVKVIPQAKTGIITLYSGDVNYSDYEIAKSPSAFIVSLVPIIESFSPDMGTAGTLVTFKGFNIGTEFSPVFKFSNNKISRIRSIDYGTTKDKGMEAIVRVYVPEGSVTGPVKVITTQGSFTTGQSFETGAPTSTARIDRFYPVSGDAGTQVTLIGAFDSDKDNNLVTFKGATASVKPNFSNGTRIQVIVPDNCRSGTIKVQTPSGDATSSDFFYLPPKIQSLNQYQGPVGYVIKIFGESFMLKEKEKNSVRINGILTQVISASTMGLKEVLSVEIPVGASTGFVTVQTPYGTSKSPGKFTVIED